MVVLAGVCPRALAGRRPCIGRGVLISRLRLCQRVERGRQVFRETGELRGIAPARKRNQSGCRRWHVGGHSRVWTDLGLVEGIEQKKEAGGRRQVRAQYQEGGRRKLVALRSADLLFPRCRRLLDSCPVPNLSHAGRTRGDSIGSRSGPKDLGQTILGRVLLRTQRSWL